MEVQPAMIETFMVSAVGVYLCSLVVGCIVGVLLAYASVPETRWPPMIATFGVIVLYTLFAIAVASVAPWAAMLFVLTGVVISGLCTAHLLRDHPLMMGLGYGQRFVRSITRARQLRETSGKWCAASGEVRESGDSPGA